VTAAYEYNELHRLVDRLTPDQVRALRAVALELVRDEPPTAESSADDQPVRRLSFVGAGHGSPDLAERSQEILRVELGGPDT
jgi:hypothetical protein